MASALRLTASFMILAPRRPTTEVREMENEAPQHSVLKFQSMVLPPTAATSLSISCGSSVWSKPVTLAGRTSRQP